MKRMIKAAMFSMLAVLTTGCVIRIGGDGKFDDGLPHYKRIVEIDGELYLLNTRTHKLHKLKKDLDAGEGSSGNAK